jgi:Rieske Fe-S protein
MTHEIDNGSENRRSFLSFAILGLGAIFSAIIGVPLACYFLDPRHRKGGAGDMKLVDGVKLDELQVDTPIQGVVRDKRTDGWTLYPNDVIGRVWVVCKTPRPAELTNAAAIRAFNDDKNRKNAYLMVFTTTCPHLGCSINVSGASFACPCHAAAFDLNGARANPNSNPAQRGMDTLEWQIDADDPNRIKVKYKKYKANDAKKIPLGGGEEEALND